MCRNGVRGCCPCNLPMEKEVFNRLGPMEPVVEDGGEKVAVGGWKHHHQNVHYREQQ